MRIAKIDTDMLIVLDEDWGTYAFKACWWILCIEKSFMNVDAFPVGNLVDFTITILDFSMVPVHGKSNERFFTQWFGCNLNH